jgi:uncharacterized protein HemY
LLAAHPDNVDVRYAVGLLALQMKDYATGEAALERLLQMNFRDPHGVRFTLGQAAEEQKKWADAMRSMRSTLGGGQRFGKGLPKTASRPWAKVTPA